LAARDIWSHCGCSGRLRRAREWDDGPRAVKGSDDLTTKTAFVLGGGGHLGAAEVGMLRALLERGVRPQLVVGTSVGAFNGAAVAAAPTVAMAERLGAAWVRLVQEGLFAGSLLSRATGLIRTRR